MEFTDRHVKQDKGRFI